MYKDFQYYIMMIDPLATADDVKEIRELNEWDLFIEFKNGRRVLYDRYTNYHKNIFYNNVDEITNDQEKREFAYRLKRLMARRNIKQDELADIIGTTQTMISRYVNGETIPNIFVVRKIAKVLKCSIDDFFYQDF